MKERQHVVVVRCWCWFGRFRMLAAVDGRFYQYSWRLEISLLLVAVGLTVKKKCAWCLSWSVIDSRSSTVEYRISTRFIWHLNVSKYGTRPFYSRGHTRIERCTAGAKILEPIGIPFLRRFRQQAINLVLQAGKDEEVSPEDKVSLNTNNHLARISSGWQEVRESRDRSASVTPKTGSGRAASWKRRAWGCRDPPKNKQMGSLKP